MYDSESYTEREPELLSTPPVAPLPLTTRFIVHGTSPAASVSEDSLQNMEQYDGKGAPKTPVTDTVIDKTREEKHDEAPVRPPREGGMFRTSALPAPPKFTLC